MEKSYYDGLIENIEADNENYALETANRNKVRVRNVRIREKRTQQILRRGLTGIALAVGFTGIIVSNNNPVNKVRTELLADAGLAMTDNGKSIDSQMSGEELAAYIDDHNLTLEQVRDALVAKLKWDMMYSEENMEMIEKTNPEAFEEMARNSK